MPPSRRRPPPTPGQVPPVRRPRVAGLRNRPATSRDEDDPQRESVSGVLDLPDAEPGPADDLTEDEAPPRRAGSARRARRAAAEAAAAEPTVAASGTIGATGPVTDEEPSGARGRHSRRAAAQVHIDDTDTGDVEDADDDLAGERPTPSRRPAGKRRATGTARPADLGAAEAGARTGKAYPARLADAPRRRGATQLSVAVVLAVVAVVLVGLAIWFRGEASDLRSGDANTALTDSATSSQVLGQLKSAIEETFSYNYTDLGATQKAVDATLTGKARCEYDQLFGQVKELAPKQKIIMATAVRDIALVRLDGDRAEALVFIDQSSTRVDVNNSVAGEAQFGVLAKRSGDHWKLTEFNMFDQHLVNGQPAPTC
ncbi:hypothetical protein [Actinophytocola sp.]|uniref:hypothetical protein n=1 Tax=Actinophytocola sp. TaxID=1872138 RepID=UPI002EDAC72D